MRRLIFGLVLAAGLAGLFSNAFGAVITTTNGEEIICTIIEDRGNYLIVDDHGYRRYVLKNNIRALDREGPHPPPRTLHTMDISGGYQVWGRCQAPDPNSLRIFYGYPLSDIGAVTVGITYGRGYIRNNDFNALRPFPGPFNWTGISAGFTWQDTRSRRRFTPTFEVSAGYYFVDHSLADWALEPAKEADAFSQNSTTLVITSLTETSDSGVGLHLAGGLMVRIIDRIWFTTQCSGTFIRSEFHRPIVYYSNLTGGETKLSYDKPYNMMSVEVICGLRFRL